ncbi:helix-turn-helix transcriptional regulator [Reichenbachiella carrageenanivorans]|uniref:Helix-turn-helix transcriptional regulator n=1 Tax=Reichenbachiella carrageenanivorans TaxID=2979869 RepID=A0ABY6D5D8_9BACT|nr:helix-turn-helix transcriptional regulator [Reichenbachiella carrageenanivorans]UXX81034.1 helix-turn-helix transcriptional regulator [Reichenbachiella carrageenanivorans]
MRLTHLELNFGDGEKAAFMEIVFLCGYAWVSIQSFLVAIAYLLKWKQPNNRFLFFVFAITSILVFVHYAYRFTGVLFSHPEFSFIHDVIELLYGPIIFHFATCITKEKLGKWAFLHYLPALIYSLYFVVFQLFAAKPFHLPSYVLTPAHTTVVYFVMFSLAIYAFGTFQLILKLQRDGKPISFLFSGWLNVLFVFLIMKVVHALILFVLKTYFTEFWFDGTTMRWSVDALFFTSCALLLIAHGNLTSFPRFFTFRFSGQSRNIGNVNVFQNLNEVIKVIDEKEVKQCGERMNVLFLEEVYTDSELSEQSLAKKIGLPKRHISRLLNFYLKTNFNEVVNFHRVNHAKKMLKDQNYEEETMFAIAMACGFKSESAFYANFKQFTGQTPKKFKES